MLLKLSVPPSLCYVQNLENVAQFLIENRDKSMKLQDFIKD